LVTIDPAVSPIVMGLTLTAVTNSSGGVNGGYEVIVDGTGFPVKSTDVTFTMCAQTCSITSLNNI
jgi:hypothetical protein